MRRKVIITIMCILLYSILLSGCSAMAETKVSQTQEHMVDSVVMVTPEPIIVAPFRTEEELETIKDSREDVITIGVVPTRTDCVYQAINSFNSSQDRYWAEVKEYDTLAQLLLELTSDKGADIYYLVGMNYSALAQNGMFEELTSYLEHSDVVCKDDIIESAWRAGCVENKFYFVLPRFYPVVMLVEKGYTDNGAWSMDDYFALAEKYPDGMLSQWVTDPKMLIINDLVLSLDSYVNWEKLSCNFDSEEFIALLEEIKIYQEKGYESLADYTLAEQLQQKKLLVHYTTLTWKKYMNAYKDMRDTVLEFCEIAGMPNDEGKIKYLVQYEEFYGMSTASDNKEAAWCFLEHTLSEEYLTLLHNEGNPWGGMFPANRNVLEKFLDAEIGNYPKGIYRHTNRYTDEKVDVVAEFTEDDKQVLLDVLENCYVWRWVETAEPFVILTEELDYYFQGGKSAEEVAKIIQNRMSLYLMECQ